MSLPRAARRHGIRNDDAPSAPLHYPAGPPAPGDVTGGNAGGWRSLRERGVPGRQELRDVRGPPAPRRLAAAPDPPTPELAGLAEVRNLAGESPVFHRRTAPNRYKTAPVRFIFL